MLTHIRTPMLLVLYRVFDDHDFWYHRFNLDCGPNRPGLSYSQHHTYNPSAKFTYGLVYTEECVRIKSVSHY